MHILNRLGKKSPKMASHHQRIEQAMQPETRSLQMWHWIEDILSDQQPVPSKTATKKQNK